MEAGRPLAFSDERIQEADQVFDTGQAEPEGLGDAERRSKALDQPKREEELPDRQNHDRKGISLRTCRPIFPRSFD
jgi:hypothetical protein